MKIRVGIPSYTGNLFPSMQETIRELTVYDKIDFDIIMIPFTYVALARCMCISKSNTDIKQKFDFDYFLSADNDMGFSVNDIKKLLAHGLPIVSAAYRFRTKNEEMKKKRKIVAGFWKYNTPGWIEHDNFLDETAKGVQKVDSVGMGCCLINKTVLENMEYPYYRHDIIKVKDRQFLAGEDTSFCYQAHRLNIPVHVDCDTLVHHTMH